MCYDNLFWNREKINSKINQMKSKSEPRSGLKFVSHVYGR